MRVAMAVSGGMDSLAGLALLKESGQDVFALHGSFLPPDEQQQERMRGLGEQCRLLGVELHEVDLVRSFSKEVIEPFTAAYADGLTPNPCALCNPRIKFGLLLDEALRLGADRIATGHYARTAQEPKENGPVLFRGADPRKDQSYFLGLVPRNRLMRALFPMAALHKSDVPALLSERGLTPPDSYESNEICFVPDDDYRAFLKARGDRLNGVLLSGPGPVVLAGSGEEVGRHKGLWNYTLGQRRGLGIAWSEPLYVLGKRVKDNLLIVGPKEGLAAEGCSARDFNFQVRPEYWPETVLLRTRYRQTAEPAEYEVEGDLVRFRFKEPRSLPAPGQAAVAFAPDGYGMDGGVLGGGIIE